MPEPDSSDLNEPSERKGQRTLFNLFGLLGQAENESETVAEDASNELITHARAFQNLKVADVMTPRADMVAVEVSATLADVIRLCVESGHSRLPIYQETLDDPVGVLHIKDTLKLLHPDKGITPAWDEQVVGRLRRDLIYVPASMAASGLLLKMQNQRSHMAVVIDEFGGTEGLVTLEDLLEAVVGDIVDEYDNEDPDELTDLGGDVFEMGGRIELETIESRLGLKLYLSEGEDEVDTIGGLVATLAGRVPQVGEVIPYPAGKIDIEVIEADARIVKRVRLSPQHTDRDTDALTADE